MVLLIMLFKEVPKFLVCEWNPLRWPFKSNLSGSTFTGLSASWGSCCIKWFSNFGSLDESTFSCSAKFWVSGWNPVVWPFISLASSTVLSSWYCYNCSIDRLHISLLVNCPSCVRPPIDITAPHDLLGPFVFCDRKLLIQMTTYSRKVYKTKLTGMLIVVKL